MSTHVFANKATNTYITKTGRVEVCRKQEKGQHCSRHEPATKTQALIYAQKRVNEKLTPFERRAMKLFSLISKTPLNKLQQKYAGIVAQYSIEGVRTPTDTEVKGLQKLLLDIAQEAPEANDRSFRRWFKKVTLGDNFSEAGFWGLRDLMKRTLNRVKTFFTGGILASTLFITSCAPGSIPATTSVITEIEEEENFVFDEEYAGFLFMNKEQTDENWDILLYSKYAWSGAPEGVFNYSTLAKESDEFGDYKRVKVSLGDEYINSIPLVYTDGTRIEGLSDTEMREALRFYSDFALNETVDSIALDNPNRYIEWLDTVGAEYFTEGMVSQFRRTYDPFGVPDMEELREYENWNLQPSTASPGVVSIPGSNTAGDKWFVEPMLRDGESRVGNKHLFNIKFEKIPYNENSIFIQSKVHFRTNVSFDDYWMSRAERDENGTLDSDRIAKWPDYGQENYINEEFSINVGYTVSKTDDGWKISGWDIQYYTWLPPQHMEPLELEELNNERTFHIKREDLRYVGLTD